VTICVVLAIAVGMPLAVIAWQRSQPPAVQASSNMPIPGDRAQRRTYAVDLDAPAQTYRQPEPPIQIEHVVEPAPDMNVAASGFPEAQPASPIEVERSIEPRVIRESAEEVKGPPMDEREGSRTVVVEPPPPAELLPRRQSRSIVVVPSPPPAEPRLERRAPRRITRASSPEPRRSAAAAKGDSMADWHKRFLNEQ
jgi:hypothetical protein